jgi:hypothetical protein
MLPQKASRRFLIVHQKNAYRFSSGFSAVCIRHSYSLPAVNNGDSDFPGLYRLPGGLERKIGMFPFSGGHSDLGMKAAVLFISVQPGFAAILRRQAGVNVRQADPLAR